MKSLSYYGAGFIILFISACTSTRNPGGILPSGESTQVAPGYVSFTPTSTSPYRGNTVVATPFLATELPMEIPATPMGEVHIEFPTIIPVEGAEYRPPLYPVPWALMPNDHFYFSSPIAATYPGDPIWDYRYGGIFFGPDVIHSGVDLPAPRGAAVLAAGSGTVVWAGVGLYSGSKYNLEDPYGWAVAIQHDFGYRNQRLFTVYAHMEEIDVILGQRVNTGDIIGQVGSTGMTTGPHLHFEVRLGENDFWMTRNPELWIASPQGYGVLAGLVTSTYGDRLANYLVMLKSLDTGKQYSVTTYGLLTANPDDYYQENVVLGNLPSGTYELNIPYGALNRKATILIKPGQITYFKFSGYAGYDFSLPPSEPMLVP